MLINSNYFREAALFHQKYQKYDDGIKGTPHYYDYWRREREKCINGITVGGVHISGYFYHYLNYCRIMLNKESLNTVHKSKKRVKVDRVREFPDYWDLDHMYFDMLRICEDGIDLADYKKLPYHLGITETEENLSGGKHMVWLKPRGVGASMKGASLPARNYFHLRESKSYMIAWEAEFLTKDGIYNKFQDIKDDININTGWTTLSQVKNDKKQMIIRNSFIDPVDEIEKGFKSEVIGITVKDNLEKPKGKRGKVVLLEELGKFPGADESWNDIRPGLEEGDFVFGTMVGFGTGAVKGGNYKALEKMFYSPGSYNILCFDNVFDEDLYGTQCALFTPAYYHINFKDEKGNSDIVRGKAYCDKEIAMAKKNPDPQQEAFVRANYPFKPSDALAASGSNIFPVQLLKSHRAKIISNGLCNIGIAGVLEPTIKGIKFRLDGSKKPVVNFPHKLTEDNSGCFVQYEEPFKTNGHTPENLYIVCVDPYAQSTYGDDTNGSESLGAAYVLKNINSFSFPDDIIVASFVGRPNMVSDFTDNVLIMAEYYNAKIGLETDQGGPFLERTKVKKKLHLLAEEFELDFNESLGKSKVKRGYGMHIGSGKDNRRKLDGDKYIAEWLLTERKLDENGNPIYNYEFIYDIALLEELVKYNINGNFDRVSAIRIGIYFMKEILFKGQEHIRIKKKQHPLKGIQLYSNAA